ncbi:kinase-like protein [Coprinellus micaceus]|uniref:Kinase-like protein n=1 Tax=Coprinellus micaceus TaxID=71717 RepID=A0A4Y7S1A3_COPMI|nr:kinase-like protein [Coprinellus micaceus]
MSVALPTVAPPPEQRNMDYPAQPRLNADIAELHDTCDLTGVITYASQYAFAHGGFSDVYLGDWTVEHLGTKGVAVEEHIPIVIKAIRAYTRDRLDFARARRIAINCAQRLNREVNILRRLSHPNIAEFLGIAFKQELRPCIVIKYYKNGITPKYLELNPKADRLALIKDVADGLRYLHTLEPPIVHGDLKGCNTLVTDDGHAIITDFGLSRIIEEYSAPTGFTTTTFGGSIRHCAPELLFDPTVDFDDEDSDQEDDGIARNPTPQSDIWLFTGLNPYPDDRYDWNIVKSFTSHQIPSTKRVSDGRDRWLKKSTQVYNLLRQCWSFNPNVRPTIQVITQELQNSTMAAEGGF